MDSESKVLKAIWENKGQKQTHVNAISKQVGFSPDYIRYICNFLVKRGQINRPKRKLDWYKLTAKGKKALKLYGIAKTPKKVRDIKKIIQYLPKKTLTKSGRSGSIAADERKLNLGRSIAKAASFLFLKGPNKRDQESKKRRV